MTSAFDVVTRARQLIADPTLCPGCHALLPGSGCPQCGLDLSGPDADEVWRTSQAAAQALDRRSELLDTLYRRVQAAPWARGAYGAGATSTAPRATPASPRPEQRAVAPSPRPLPLPRPVAPPVPRPVAPVPRPWRVQSVLLVLGAVLLAAACVTFLVVAWGSFPLSFRAAVIGLATVLVFATASVLRRRGLPQGAEAVGALAVVLLLLDASALRRTGLVAAGPAWAYWSLALCVCAAVLAPWGWGSRLRTGPVAAGVLWLAAPLPLLGWHPGVTAVPWVASAVVVAAGVRFVPTARLRLVPAAAAVRLLPPDAALRLLPPATPAPRLGRHVLAWGAALASGFAGVWAAGLVASGAVGWAPAAQLTLLTALATATAATTATTATTATAAPTSGPDRPAAWSGVTGVAAALALAASAAQLAAGEAVPVRVAAATAAAALLAAAGAFVGRRSAVDTATTAAMATAGVLTVGTVLGTAALTLDVAFGPGRDGLPLGAPAGALALAALAASLHATRRERPGAARAGAGLGTVAAVAGTLAATAAAPRPWTPVLALLALAGLGLAAELLPVRAADAPGSWRAWRDGARAGSVAAVVLALGPAARAEAATGVTLAALAVLVAASRRWHPAAAPVATGLSGLVAAAGCAFLLAAGGLAPADATATAAAIATVVLGGVAFLVPRVGRPESLAAWGAGVLTAMVGWTAAAAASGASATPAVVAAALALLGAALWRSERVGTECAIAVAAAAAPVVALVAPTLRATVWPALPPAGAVLTAAAVGAAGALLSQATVRRLGPAARTAGEGGAVATLAAALLAGLANGWDTVGVVLLVGGAAALGVGLLPDRRPLRWVALGLATAASWVLLGARGVGPTELYVVPLGLVLTAVGARRARGRTPAATGLLTGGLALALGPSALLGGSIHLGDVDVRRVWVAAAASTLLVSAVLLAARGRDRADRAGWAPVWPVVGAGAAVAVLGPAREALVAAAHGWGVTAEPPEAWAFLAAALLLGAARVLALGPTPRPARWWPVALAPALAAAVGPSLLAAAVASPGTQAGQTRLVIAFAVAGVSAVAAQRAHLVGGRDLAGLPALRGTAVALAAAAALVGTMRLAGVPSDVPLVVLGVLLLVLGGQSLAARPHVRTWPALGAGLAGVLAVPALTAFAASLVPGGGTWRPTYLVVAGVVAVTCGAALRWQAPFVCGSVTLAVVGGAQLLPWAATVLASTGGWPVLAVGGALLLGLGLTYERRLAQAREATRFVATMR